MNEARRGRLHVLDLLKFLSALAIVLYHYNSVIPLRNHFFHRLCSYGWVFTELFFIISGFFAATEEDRIAGQGLLPFFLRRARRIYPVHLLAFAVSILITKLQSRTALRKLGLKAIVSQALLLPTVLDNPYDLPILINGPTWYLIVLLVCSFLFWFILRLTRRKGHSPLPVYAAIVLLSVAQKFGLLGIPLADAYFRGFLSFFAGCVFYRLYLRFRGRKAAITGLVLFLSAVGLALRMNPVFLYRYMITVLIAFPALLLFVLNWPWLGERLRHPLVRELGGLSFSVFLFDAPFLSIHIGTIFPGLMLSGETLVSLGMLFANSALLVLLCIPIYLFFEKPIDKKLRAIGRAAEERRRTKSA